MFIFKILACPPTCPPKPWRRRKLVCVGAAVILLVNLPCGIPLCGNFTFGEIIPLGEQAYAKSNCSPEGIPNQLRALAMQGMDAIYAVHLDEAEKQFKQLSAEYPLHPFGHFGEAMTKWARFEYEHEESNPQLDKEYLELTDKAIKVGWDWVDDHPCDAHAYMALGGMYGLRARLALMQHKWIRAYIDGRKAIKNMRHSLEIDPELYDAYLGLGMYEYYAGTLPGVIRILAKLLVSGNAKKGIDYLMICKEKGFFNATAAELLLIEFFTQPGSPYANPPLAVKWSKELRRKFSYHPMLHFVEIVSLFEDKQYQETIKQAFEYLKYVKEKKPLYKEVYVPRALLAIATSHLAQGELEKSLEYFMKGTETMKENEHPNRWAVWAYVRAGNVMDLTGQREKAVEHYKKALSYKDEWGFTDYIEEYLSRPYTAKELPGALPPP
ncbi:MAG: tetratricopeptide repeat protein [Elusimicrobia bacterium]|nr:tetratricopeptide repeat protein [Elusimicrobiota bacterium]